MHDPGKGFAAPDGAEAGLAEVHAWLGSAIALLEAPHRGGFSVGRFHSDARRVDSPATSTREKQVAVHYDAEAGARIDVLTCDHPQRTDPGVAELWSAIVNVRLAALSGQGLGRDGRVPALPAGLGAGPFDHVPREVTVTVDGEPAVWRQIEITDPGTGVAHLAAGGPSGESYIVVAGPSTALRDVRIRLWTPGRTSGNRPAA